MRRVIRAILSLLICTEIIFFNGCYNFATDNGLGKEDTNEEYIDVDGIMQVVNMPSSHCVVKIKDDPYEGMNSFRDENYYYYFIPLGSISGVPLEDDSKTITYNGVDYSYEYTVSVTDTESIEKAMTETEENCISLTLSRSVETGIKFEEILSVSAESGYALCFERSKTRSESIKSAKSHAESESKTVSISFDKDDNLGYYRWILLGTLDVYALVIYDISDTTFYIDTYSVIKEQAYGIEYCPLESSFDELDKGSLNFEFDESLIDVSVEPQWLKDFGQKGIGTLDSPYLINTVTQLYNISLDSYSKLICDIDFEGATLCSLGEFSGTLDGNGYCIYNFNITGGDMKNGLFSVNNGTIKNLVIGKSGAETSICITKSGVGSLCVGAISGVNGVNGKIENCKVENVKIVGQINQNSSGRIYCYVGGISGVNGGSIKSSTVADCELSACAKYNSAHHQNTYAIVGGITGENGAADEKCGSLSYCLSEKNSICSYATAGALGFDEANAYSICGGIIGKAQSGSTAERCVSDTNDLSSDGSVSSTLWGKSQKYCYSGSLFGERLSEVICQKLCSVNNSDMIGNGEESACKYESSVKYIDFYGAVGYSDT